MSMTFTLGVGGAQQLEAALEDMRPDERLPVAHELGDTSLMFLTHPTMGTSDMDDMVEAVDKVMNAATA